ncbi:MAG: TIGR03016 family PEP-CTERM system-associated outer membrane protein, partial [Sphingomonadales bacterium]|nr:TIGR03016 family PEP-CTERM system-associated outer membrane protein [Sphingomonadales bacterium]
MMRPLKKGMPGAWPALALVFGMAAVVAAIGPAESAEVRITPRLEVRETYTDNVNLTPTDSLVPGDIRQDDFVTTVSPGLSAQITGTRVQLRASYTANYLVFANLGMDDLRHSLQSSATIEPIENYLSIDTQASISQQFLDREGGFSGSDANLTGNRGTIRSFSSSPRFAVRFGQIAETTVRYRFSYITTNDERMLEGLADTLTDAVRHSASVNITSGPAFGRLRWSLNGEIDRENREDSTGTDVPNFGGDTVSLGLQYALDRTFSLRGSVSYRDTDNVSLTDPGNNLAWDAGLNVNPNRRLSMNFTVGKNQGNTTFGGSLDYQWTNKTRVSINYTDRIQTSQGALASNLPQIGPGDDGGLV